MLLGGVLAVCVWAGGMTGQAQFLPDEFNGTELGSQWTWNDSSPAGSVYTMTGTHFEIKAMEGADTYFFSDSERYAYIEQDAPTGTNWEVVTKLEGFNPTEAGKQNNWNKCGIMIWQDNFHWYSVRVMGNDGQPGWDRWVEGAYNCIEDTGAGTDPRWRHAGDQSRKQFYDDPVWLRIRKTEHGYFGAYSTDGENWHEINRMFRNSQAPETGYFENEKIRIFQSGPGTAGVNDTGRFDFIRTAPVTVPTAEPGQDDDFDGTTLDTDVWGVWTGILTSEVYVEGGKLKLKPADWNDQWENLDGAVRVYQDAPVSGDWQVTVKAGPTALFDYQVWSGYGMMLWQDQNHYVHLGLVRSNTGEHLVQVAYQRDDAYAWNVFDGPLGSTLMPDFLRITKVGTRYTASYSYDEVTWTEAPVGGYVYPEELKNPQVQLMAKKVNEDGGVEMIAEFDWVEFETLNATVGDWTIY